MNQSNFNYYIAGTLIGSNNQMGNQFGISLFIKTIESNPEDYNTWLSVGEWLTQLVKKNIEYYLLGLSCLKKAFSINPECTKESHSYNNNLIDEKIWKNQTIASIDSLEIFKIKINTDLIILEFNRIQDVDFIKRLSESRDILFYEFLKYIIQNEENFEIRIAALKRIYYFKNQINLEEFFKELSQTQKIDDEPFFNLALYNINENWSNKLLNRTIIENISEPYANSQIKLDFELMKLFEEISYAFEYRHFKYFIKAKRYDKLYRSIRRSDIRVYKLQVRKVLNIDEELTEFGIKCLEKYVGIDNNL
ncbi:hypothetical protein [Chryseobacterium sp. FH1]|uniref:hypothetical protein n=1 Tax=Chryseobacterium sp. FH1 TaxID=1233951 RepID=UPI000B220F06|nr:hypothetical protein [Chryseobacterium sp. FH1]